MWLSGKDKKSFWKKSKNPWSSRGFVQFTFDLSTTSVEELHLKKDFGKIQKSISCQGYPWNPWGNFFQLVTVIPPGEHHLHLLSAHDRCKMHKELYLCPFRQKLHIWHLNYGTHNWVNMRVKRSVGISGILPYALDYL